jgi:hypothetical protein
MQDTLGCATTLNNLGKIFFARGQIAQSLLYQKQSLEMLPKAKQCPKLAYSIVYSDLSDIYRAQSIELTKQGHSKEGITLMMDSQTYFVKSEKIQKGQMFIKQIKHRTLRRFSGLLEL